MYIKRLLLALCAGAFLQVNVVSAQPDSLPKLILTAKVPGTADETPVYVTAATPLPGSAPLRTKVSGGQFSLETSLPRPDVYLIQIGDETPAGKPVVYQLFLDNEPVSISIDTRLHQVQVSEGAAPRAFADIVQGFGPMFDNLNKIAQGRQQAGNQGYYSDSLTQAWDRQLDQIAGQLPAFLDRHRGSAASAMLLNTVWPLYNNVSQMDGWIARLDPGAMKNIYGQALEQQMMTERLFGIGAVAPDFVQNDPDGNPVSLQSFRGKYVLVDFWASWCGPCRVENPNLVRAFQRFKDRNFTVLGVSLDREKPNWLRAIQDDKLTWPHVSDLKFWQNEVAQLYRVQSIPQNYLLDPEGRIIGKNLRGEALDQFLAKTLGDQ